MLICIFTPPTPNLHFCKVEDQSSLRTWGLLESQSHLPIPGCRKHNLSLCTHTQTRLTPALSNGKSDRSAATARQSGLYLRVEQVCAISSLTLSYWFKIEQTVAAHHTTSYWFLLCLYCASICSPFLRPTGTEPLKKLLSFFFILRHAHGRHRMFMAELDRRDQWRPVETSEGQWRPMETKGDQGRPREASVLCNNCSNIDQSGLKNGQIKFLCKGYSKFSFLKFYQKDKYYKLLREKRILKTCEVVKPEFGGKTRLTFTQDFERNQCVHTVSWIAKQWRNTWTPCKHSED